MENRENLVASAAVEQHFFHTNKLIINHDIMHCTADGVKGNYLYSGRALGISEPWDLIQLHPELQPLWNDISKHYDRIGLSHSRDVIWNVDMRELGTHIGHSPSVFFYGPNEYRFWGDDKWLKTVDYINSKNNFMALATNLGIDIPRTDCFYSVADIDREHMDQLIYPCYLKAAVSVSGVGIYRCENREEFIDAIQRFEKGIPVQIQEEVLTDSFLNLQYQVVDGELEQLTCSEQILDGFAHQGNRVPSNYEPWESVEPMARWLYQQGIKGIFAFDVAVIETEWGVRFPAIECNPRFNGASYPTLIAEKLDIPEWSAVTLKTGHRDLASIDLSGIEYDPNTGHGVIIVNWGIVLAGKLVVLLAGSSELQDALRVELASRL